MVPGDNALRETRKHRLYPFGPFGCTALSHGAGLFSSRRSRRTSATLTHKRPAMVRMSMFDSLLGNGDSRPPAPEVATAEDIERYEMEWIRHHEPDPDDLKGKSEDPTLSLPFAKQDGGENARYRSEFPWLYEPTRGVRWDFDPIQLRNLAQGNTWVGMLVQSITKEVSETPWTIGRIDDDTELQKRLATHPEKRTRLQKDLPDRTAEQIAGLLRNPNPDIDWHDAAEMWLADLLEVGSAVGVKAFPEAAYTNDDNGAQLARDPSTIRPRAIMPSAPEVWTKGYSDRTGLLDAYWQFDRERAPGSGNSGGGTTGTRGFRKPIRFDAEEIMWTDMTPRTNRRYGMPPTLLVKDFLKSLDLAIKQEQQYLSRGSTPSGAIVFENWDREQVKEWKEENEENIKGKPWKLLMFAGMEGEVRFEPFSYNFQEMQFEERMKWYARVVSSVFQVPTAVVGIEPERVNYNTFQGERENFEENTLGPYLMKLERWINSNLIEPHWGREYHFEFKPGVSESTRQMVSERVRSEFDAGLRRRNEARREVGLDPVDDDADGFKDEVTDDVDADDAGDALGDLVASQLSKSADADELPTTCRECEENTRMQGNFRCPECHPDTSPEEYDGPMAAETSKEADRPPLTDSHRYGPLEGDYTCENHGATFESSEIAEGSCPWCGEAVFASKQAEEFAADIFRVVAAPDDAEEFEDRVLGLGVDFPNDAVYVDWRNEVFPDELEHSHVSIYGTVEDLEQATGNETEPIETLDAATESELAASLVKSATAGSASEVAKDDDAEDTEALRNTDEWPEFDVQPSDVDELTEEIADDVGELFDAVLSDSEIEATIDRLAAPENADEMSKSLSELTRRLRQLLDGHEVATSIAETIREHSTIAASEALRSATADTGEETDIDVDAITEQLRDRDVRFADRFADRMADEIRETVADGWAEGKNSLEIREEIAQQADISEGWNGAEKIARQELQIATGQARSEFAAEVDKVEVWHNSQDNRVRPAHEDMHGKWKRPGEDWEVDYSEEGRGVQKESVPGDSEPGIGCRCHVLLRDLEEVADEDHAGV